MDDRIKDAFCNYCGSPLIKKNIYPKRCEVCDIQIWDSVPSASVGLVPVLSTSNNSVKVLLIKRNIDPGKGCWAMPGGYIDRGETWQEALTREVKEETGIDVTPCRLVDVFTSQINGNIIIFGLTNPIMDNKINKSFKDKQNEVQGVIAHPITQEIILAFSTQQRALDKFKTGQYKDLKYYRR